MLLRSIIRICHYEFHAFAILRLVLLLDVITGRIFSVVFGIEICKAFYSIDLLMSFVKSIFILKSFIYLLLIFA